MKEKIKNTKILGKTVRPDKAKMLKQVQHDMGWVQGDMEVYGHCERMRSNPAYHFARSADKVLSLFTSHLSRKFGFTLAEVLITLGIIGVVAAMTMPSLIQKYQERETVVKLKKFYSTLSQSYLFAVQKYGTPSEWGISDRSVGTTNEDDDSFVSDGGNLIKQRLFENVKKIKDCDDAKKSDRCTASEYYYLNGNKDTLANNGSTTAGVMADGSVFLILPQMGQQWDNRGNGALSQVFGLIYLDTNGKNPPNTYGKDLFFFYLTNKGIVPAGTEDEAKGNWPFSSCHQKGAGCAAWVIYNENMDYLHCDDLSWNGKHKCSD